MSRSIDHVYRDPIDVVWAGVARRLGWTIRRSTEVFASWDGDRTLTLSVPDDFDADDSLGQMIFHEICHALVQGPGAPARIDWGLENTDDRDAVREHGCHRLQAALADTVGLRDFMAVTTDWRPYYDQLPADPLAPGDDPAIELARAAWRAATRGPWADAIRDGLEATAAIASAIRPFARADDLWGRSVAPHPLGGPIGPSQGTCGDCAWRVMAGPGPRVGRCLQRRPPDGIAPRVEPDWPGCAGWEPVLTEADCGACGACCRQGFDLVQIGAREPLVSARPDLVERDGSWRQIPRPGGYCVALERAPGVRPEAPYRCSVYAMRPRSCRDFPVAGHACLEARRRVGLSHPVRRLAD